MKEKEQKKKLVHTHVAKNYRTILLHDLSDWFAKRTRELQRYPTRKRQIKKYTSHTIAPRVAKHCLYTFIICRLKFDVSSGRKILPQRGIITHRMSFSLFVSFRIQYVE